jgi:hypothetical protein
MEARLARERVAVGRDILAIQRSLASIARALARLKPVLESAARDPTGRGHRGRKLRLSPARRASLKLQGQYIGYMRSLKPRQKARVKALRAANGVRAAINLARRVARAARA